MNAVPASGMGGGRLPDTSGPCPETVARAAALAGLDLKAVGAASLRRAVANAMSRLGVDAPAYLELLARDSTERRLLAGESVVQESWLFRDPDAYAALARMLRSLPGDARPLRILSAPCAGGEEPASIAVSLMQAGFAPEDFLVDAVDANPQALHRGRTGVFPPASVRGGVPPAPYFRPGEPDGFVLDELARSRIRFFEADVLDESFFLGHEPYQAIFCRHLLIYLAPEARQRLASTLSRLLAPGGVLFTTPAEAAAFQELGLPTAPRRNANHDAVPSAASAQAPETRAPGQARTSQPEATREPERIPAGQAYAKARPLADAGFLDEALEVIEHGLETEGPCARLYHLKGAVLLALGREPEAEAALRRAVYLDPGHLEALTHLEHLSRARGLSDEAERLSRRAMRAAHNTGAGQP
ncbi:MAG: CheR family methyltransferase [Acidobacteriota bacterium]